MGLFEGAYVSVRRLHMPDHPVWPLTPDSFDLHLGAVDLFTGQVIDSKVSQTVATLAVHSHTERPQLGLPRNLVQPQCPNTLYTHVRRVAYRRAARVPDPFQALARIAAVTDLANTSWTLRGPSGPPLRVAVHPQRGDRLRHLLSITWPVNRSTAPRWR